MTTMWILVIVTLHILGFLSAIKAVMEARTSQGAIAWVVFLLSFPYISLPIYWIFGRSKFHGYISKKQIEDKKIQHKLDKIVGGLETYIVSKADSNKADTAAGKLADLPLLRGNAVNLLIDGEMTFSSILEGIAEAQSYILFQFFIITDDEIGNKIKDALITRAKKGIKIYVLYDEVGSHKLPASYKNALKNEGVEVYPFNTRKGIKNKFQINFRNHRKVVVVDGKKAWIGGHNVGDEYLGKSQKFGHWRDTHIVIEGPAVLSAQISFVEDWFWATGQEVEVADWKPIPSKESDLKVLIVSSGPADPLETAALMFHHAINMAQDRIWITSPYFVPDDAILSALQLAGLRGVDVRILIPDKPDHLLVFLAAYTYFEDVARTGVRFFRYTDGFLHQKVMLIDDKVSAVGTANFDNRSFRLNFEITAIIEDLDFASGIEKMLLEDFSHAREMTPEDIEGMSFGFRLATRLARLTSPIQ